MNHRLVSECSAGWHGCSARALRSGVGSSATSVEGQREVVEVCRPAVVHFQMRVVSVRCVFERSTAHRLIVTSPFGAKIIAGKGGDDYRARIDYARAGREGERGQRSRSIARRRIASRRIGITRRRVTCGWTRVTSRWIWVSARLSEATGRLRLAGTIKQIGRAHV